MKKSENKKSNSVIEILRSKVGKNVDRFDDNLTKTITLVKRKQKKKRKTKPEDRECKFLTRKEKNSLNLYRIPKTSLKYKELLGMHQMWKEYMSSQIDWKNIPLVGGANWENLTQTIHKSDFHGAMISVTSSTCPSLVGVKGVCVMDTKNTFKLVGEDDITRTVPKDVSVFKFHLDECDFIVYGKHINRRPAERSVRKSKTYNICDL